MSQPTCINARGSGKYLMSDSFSTTLEKLAACAICTERFSHTKTAHKPRPIIWVNESAPILVAGQAPGLRVHESGKPFDDASGERLRDWMGLTKTAFYDRDQLSILPMAFCFPGYNKAGHDLPPPAVCGKTWHFDLLQHIKPKLTLLIGGYAQKFHFGDRNGRTVTETVHGWQAHAPRVFPLPHPSWRNTGWIKKNPWFETDLIPALQFRVKEVLSHD